MIEPGLSTNFTPLVPNKFRCTLQTSVPACGKQLALQLSTCLFQPLPHCITCTCCIFPPAVPACGKQLMLELRPASRDHLSLVAPTIAVPNFVEGLGECPCTCVCVFISVAMHRAPGRPWV